MDAKQKLSREISNISNPKLKKYKFDLKTKLSDKIEHYHTKIGLQSFIIGSSWCDIKETGEDYAVWIKSLKRSKPDPFTTKLSFTLELREGSLFLESKLCVYKEIEIEYSVHQNWIKGAKDIGISEIITFCHEEIILMFEKTAPIKKTELNPVYDTLIESYFVNSSIDKAEALIAGGYAFAQLKTWINEIEAGK